MGVRNIGANDFPEGALTEFFLHVSAQFFDGFHEGCVIFVGEVVDFVDLVFGNYEGVALRFRVDVEEGEGFVVFVDFVAGDFTVDDFCEYAWHFSCSF